MPAKKRLASGLLSLAWLMGAAGAAGAAPGVMEPAESSVRPAAGFFAPQPLKPEEIAAFEATGTGAVKKDGRLVLEHLRQRALAAKLPIIEGPRPNYYTYRGMKVAMALKADAIAVRLEPGVLPEAAVLAAARSGLKVAGAEAIADGYVVLSLAEPLADLDDAARLVELLGKAAGLSFASPVFVSALDETLWCFPGQAVVVRGDGLVLPAGADAAGLSPVALVAQERAFGGLEGASLLVVGSRSGFDTLVAANALAAMPDAGVVFAEPVMYQSGSTDVEPNDPEFVRQWHHRNLGQVPGATVGFDLRTPRAWELSTGTGILIAVNDSGVEQNHPDINQLPGRDFTLSGPGGTGIGNAVYSCEIHGTACAGLIAATGNNGVDTIGVAPGSSVLSARFAVQSFGPPCSSGISASSTALVNALAWSLSAGARISSNSFSLGTPLQAIDDRFVANFNAGMLNFNSSGNNARGTLNYPASAPGTLAVGAVSAAAGLAFFSNYGDGLDFTAPGIAVVTSDRVGALGYNATSTVSFSGTSASAPIAAGVAALVMSRRPTASATQVVDEMRSAVVDLGAGGYDTLFGYGVVQATNLPSAPINDACSRAVAITSLPYSASQDTLQATLAPGEQLPSCVTTASRSVWYSYTNGPSAMVMTVNTTGSAYDTVLSVHESCNMLTTIACNDNFWSPQSLVTFTAQPNTTYLIRVCGYGGNEGGYMVLNVSSTLATAQAPRNDTQAGAIPLSISGTTVTRGTTVAATADAPPSGSCGSSASSPDVWYSLTSPCPRRFALTLLENAPGQFNTVMGIYTGSPGALVPVACNDNCGSSQRSCLTLDAQGGATYYVRVSGVSGATGQFDLQVVPQSVPGDDCSGAIPLASGNTQTFSTDCRTDSQIELQIFCALAEIYRDGWFSYTPPADAQIELTAASGTIDAVLAVYRGCPQEFGFAFLCNDNANPQTTNSRLAWRGVAGQPYLIRVGSAAPGIDGFGEILLTATLIPPPCLADIDRDGTVDGDDFIAFINSFGIGIASVDPRADVTGLVGTNGAPAPDGTIDGSDFIEFINAFAAGC